MQYLLLKKNHRTKAYFQWIVTAKATLPLTTPCPSQVVVQGIMHRVTITVLLNRSTVTRAVLEAEAMVSNQNQLRLLAPYMLAVTSLMWMRT